MRRQPLVVGLAAICLLSAILWSTSWSLGAAPPGGTPAPGAWVSLGGHHLFSLQARVGSFGPTARAEAVARRLEQVARDRTVPVDTIAVAAGEGVSDIVAGDQVLLSVTDADAAAAGKTRPALAAEWAGSIRVSVEEFRERHSTENAILELLYTALATTALVVVLLLAGRGLRRLLSAIESWRATHIRPLRIQQLQLVSADRVTELLLMLVRIVRLAIGAVAILVYLSIVFSFFPATRGVAETAVSQVVASLHLVGGTALGYLPSLIFIAVIAVLAFLGIKFLRLIAGAIETGSIVIPSFYADWAQPTYKIARFFVVVVAAIIMFPYVPGSASTSFRAISIFLGAVVSLGSTSAVSNIVAGVVLTYTRAFQIGDRVEIGDTTGDVVAKTLLVTRVRTIKNVDVTIPNSQVLSSHVSNFSACAREHGLILHTTVTIGYDAPWRTVHELLTNAARATDGVLAEPAPFVLQTALSDFYVSYQINAYTDRATEQQRIYSDLHQNIQDYFNRARVEICSPHYRALRDGNTVTTPAAHRPEGYAAPAFRISRVPGQEPTGDE